MLDGLVIHFKEIHKKRPRKSSGALFIRYGKGDMESVRCTVLPSDGLGFDEFFYDSGIVGFEF